MRRKPFAVTLLAAIALLAGCGDDQPFVSKTKDPAPYASINYTPWKRGLSQPVADAVYPARGSSALDVLQYDLKISWTPATTMLVGLATLRIRPTADAPALSLDFMPFTVDGVSVDHKDVKAAVTGEKLVVATEVEKDHDLTLIVSYHGRPATTPAPSRLPGAAPLGLTVTPGGELWSEQQPYGAFTWYPVNDSPADRAMYDVSITVPDGWVGVAAGKLRMQNENTYLYRSLNPIASANQTLAVGPYSKAIGTGPHNLPLTYWYRPGVDERLLPTLRQAPAMLTFLESRFGHFPFDSTGTVIVDAATHAATQQTITLGGRAAGLTSGDLVREYAHQWFGDAVGVASWNDRWLSDGWATYAQMLWEQSQTHMSGTALEASLRRSDAALRKQYGPPGRTGPADFDRNDVGIGGAAMLKALNDVLGDTAFFTMAKAWASKHRDQPQTRQSFISFVNAQTGHDATALINAWLDSPTTPR